jgi:hypothetical protein
MLRSWYRSINFTHIGMFLRLWKLALDPIITEWFDGLILPWSRGIYFLSQYVDSWLWTNQRLRSFWLYHICFDVISLWSWYCHQIVKSWLLLGKFLGRSEFGSRRFQRTCVNVVGARTRTSIFSFRCSESRRTFWRLFKFDTFIFPKFV